MSYFAPPLLPSGKFISGMSAFLQTCEHAVYQNLAMGFVIRRDMEDDHILNDEF
jgi:hypothetical protein